MKHLQQHILQSPLTFCGLFTLLSVGLLFCARIVTDGEFMLFNWPRLISKIGLITAILVLLSALCWQRLSGLATAPSHWQSRWLLASLPMAALALLNVAGAQWQDMVFTNERLVAWLLANGTTGLFEELLMRGFCFYALYRAWGGSKKAVIRAAWVQAVMFGGAHLINLYHMHTIDVLAQVIYATLIGFGFAGLVYLTQSLWPAIIAHTMINGASSLNQYFVPDFVEPSDPNIVGYMVIIVIFVITCAIPGQIYLNKAKYAHGTS